MTVVLLETLQVAATGPIPRRLGAAERYLSLEVDFALPVVGLMIVLVGHVVDMGRELEEQDRLVI